MARERIRPVPPPEADRGGAPDPAGAPGDDSGGYKNPPRHSQFKPGQSGNPKGRPAGSKNFNTLIERELDKKVTIREGGRTVRLTKREVLVKQLVKKGIEGDHRAQQTLLKLDQELATSQRSANDNAPPPDAALDPDDRVILDEFVAMIKHSAAQEAAIGTDRKNAARGPATDFADEEVT